MTFTMGEEVLYDGDRYVIWGMEPNRYRLLASTKQGTKIIWANPKDVEKIRKYTEARNDTAKA
jgi:uncharacterized protein with von Willebrand factor type A (vWA) domain